MPTFEEAAEALSGAVQAEQGLDEFGQPRTATPAEPVTPAAEIAAEDPPSTDDQGDADMKALLESLPPEAREFVSRREKQMQADYTKKTQDVAEQRKAMEADLQFLETIRTDPYAALQFHQELAKALEDAGLTPAQAAAEATAQIEEAAAEPAPSYEDDPDAALKAEIDELKKWRAAQEAQGAEREQEAELQRVEGELTRQEMAIRQSNEKYTDTDIDRIYEIAFAHGGNLVAAQERYEEMRNDFISSYVDAKGSTSHVGEPAVGGASVTPKKFESVDEAHEAAQTALRNYLAAE